jgi:hypothetical protein
MRDLLKPENEFESKMAAEVSLSQKSTSAKSNNKDKSENQTNGDQVTCEKPQLFQVESNLLEHSEIPLPFQTVEHDYRTSPLPDVSAATETAGEAQRPAEPENIKTDESNKPCRVLTAISKENASI